MEKKMRESKLKELLIIYKEGGVYFYLAHFAFLVLILAFILFLVESSSITSLFLKSSLILGSLPFWYLLLRDLWNKKFGVDIIAGVALIGTYLVGQYLAGIVVLLMLSGGQLFEGYAMRRARRELSKLLSRTPLFANQKIGNEVTKISINKVRVGMLIVIKEGEIVTVDGIVIEGITEINEATLSGESLPKKKTIGARVYAGTENISGVIVVRVEKETKESRYQSIVKLVQDAEKSKAPIVRLADSYSIYFTIITFFIAIFAWIISHDLLRVVAVLVVATPCPLLLAVPIAIMSGMNKASARGVIIKDGTTLETLSKVDTFFFDKTGTLTIGKPEVVEILPLRDTSPDEILRISSSLEQLSNHPLSLALVKEASVKKSKLSYPENFTEQVGDGISGELEGRVYYCGKRAFIEKMTHHKDALQTEIVYEKVKRDGVISVFLGDTHSVLGEILFKDILRSDAKELFNDLHACGIKNISILTGDKKESGERVAQELGKVEIISECLPEDKLRHIKERQWAGALVAMVGDGINDAPALAKADVGIALGIHGQTASSEVADIVILSSSVGKVYDVLHISKKTIALAKQSIYLGIGASIIAMIASAFGYIPPLVGVILQEIIDIVVIINALSLGNTLKLKDSRKTTL